MVQRTRHGRRSDKGQKGCPQSACYGHATGGLSAYYPGRISTVTAIFPARIFKILCGFFRPEFSYIFFRPGERLQQVAVVVISSNGEEDRSVESLEVIVPGGWGSISV